MKMKSEGETQPCTKKGLPNIPLPKNTIACRIIGGYQNTRTNKEDFALTPYLFSVWVTGEIIKVRGVGICWGHHSVYLGLLSISCRS
jgi:hypothetical protein